MKELAKSEQLTQAERNRLDACENDINASNLNLCIVMSEIPDKQVAIVAYTGRTKGVVSNMIAVGERSEKYATGVHLPEGWRSLYALSDLTAKQIKELCKDKVPTRNDISEYKIKIGKLPAPPEKVEVVSGDILATLAMLLPASAMQGLNEFAIRSLNKDRAHIEGLLKEANKSVSKELMTVFMDILKYQGSIFNRQMKQYAKAVVADREAELKKREAAVSERESQLVNGIPEKDKKYVYGVVHPDMAPSGMEKKYAKAFDIVRKWH